MALVKDIDKQKRAELSLQESEEHYRVLSQNTPDIIMRYDTNFKHLFVNDSVRDFFGIPSEDFLNRSFRELGIFQENFLETWEKNISRVFSEKKSYEVEFMLDIRGSQRYVEWRLFPEFNDEGVVSTVLTVARDITDKKLASRKLRESEEMLHVVFDTIPLAVFWKDRNSIYLGGNKPFTEFHRSVSP